MKELTEPICKRLVQLGMYIDYWLFDYQIFMVLVFIFQKSIIVTEIALKIKIDFFHFHNRISKYSSLTYIHRVSKNDNDVAQYNFNAH